MTALQIFLPVYEALFLGIALFWRTYQVWRKTGVNPYRLGREDNIHGFMATLFRLTVIGSVLIIAIYSFAQPLYPYLTPIPWLETPFITGFGVAACIIALLWVVVAQSQMGESWRIGIDSEHETPLVTHGLFRRSRNPIFLGMRLNLAGFFLVLPNALTLAIWLVGDVAIQAQVYLEEEHLRRLHGPTYEDYCREVRRWL
jgi:protein-S-isoprenylcysteine O-methyltransferase Ste14